MARLAFITNLLGLDGSPESGGLIDSFVKDTSTRTPIYAASSGGATLTNPAVADALGQITGYLDDAIEYSLRAKTANEATILWEADVISGVISITFVNPAYEVAPFLHANWLPILQAPPGDGIDDLLAGSVGTGWTGIIPEVAPFAAIEEYGGVADGVGTNTAAYNTWLAAAIAGTVPKTLYIGTKGFGTYLFSTKPNKIEDVEGIRIIIGPGVTVKMGFNGADESEALFHYYGNSSFGVVDFVGAAIGTAAGCEGGSLIRFEAKASAAPSNGVVRVGYCTTYGGQSAKVITAATTASEGVFTSAAHGYTNGQRICLASLSGGTFDTLNEASYDISDITTDTFKLKLPGTSTYVNTSGLGSYGASSGTVTRALTYDAAISIDGMDKSTGVLGVRVTTIENSGTIFGGRKGAIYAEGYRDLTVTGGSISSAGYVGRPYLSGSVGVDGQNAKFANVNLPGINLDRADETNLRAANNTGTITTTGNTGDVYRPILLNNSTANQGVVTPSGTQDISVNNSAPLIGMVETDNSNVISRMRGIAGSMLIECDPTSLASGSVIYLATDGGNRWQAGTTEHFTSVPIYPLTDDALDLGTGSFRFDDIFATNATIQTSDERIKQDVEPLSAAELRAGGKIAKLIRTYRMISAVQEKGDEARVHTGLIAQRVAEALESEGLDPWRYAFMCRDLIEWQDPQFGLRARVAEAQNRIPDLEAELAHAEAMKAGELSEIGDDPEGEQRRAIAKLWDAAVADTTKRLGAERETARMEVSAAPAWFESYERLSLRYGEIWPWLIAAQEQRLERLEGGVIP